MNDATVFEHYRSLLFAIAYRMLGGVAEAEDMVQETFLRWQRQAGENIQSAKALLTTIVTRLCIDHLRSARDQREEYVGVWLPEPLLVDDGADPSKAAELSESLTNAFLLVVETLSPVERAIFLLREVFGYEFSEVSQIVGKTEANCRQLALRARERLASRRPRFPTDTAKAEELVNRFLVACENGDSAGLVEMLTQDATIYSDGGGKVPAARKPVVGAERVAKFFVTVRRYATPGTRARFAIINAEPGALIFVKGTLEQSMTFELAEGRIRAVYVVRNPDKLKHLEKQNEL